MSEEEIIYILKQRIERKTVSSDPYYITQKAIEGILDLYQKEKEKNNELEKDISEMYYKGVVLDILQDELNISRDEAIEILENY